MGGCHWLFGDSGNADGPHEMVDVLAPAAILRGFYYDKKKNTTSFIKNLQILFWLIFTRNSLNVGDF
jgi:hypothetical protein